MDHLLVTIRTALLLGVAAVVVSRIDAGASLGELNGDGKVVVLCFGDSITAGSIEGTYPAEMRRLLGNEVIITNEGRYGEATDGGLVRLRQLLPESHADYVIILEGVNDHCDAPDATYAHLEQMASEVRKSGAEPLVGTLFPSLQKTGLEKHRCFEALNARILQMPDVTPLDFASRFQDRWDDLLRDGVHPNSEGYEVLARVAEGGLRRASLRAHERTHVPTQRQSAHDPRA